MASLLLIFLAIFCFASPARAQTPVLSDQAKALLGTWEFSNASKDRRCTATFSRDKTAVGFEVEFDAGCGDLFPLVRDVTGWIYPDNDLLRLLNAQGRTLMEFSEVEDGIYEAPTPGVGVLFLQNAAAGAGPEVTAQQVAGTWALARGNAVLCTLMLTPNAVKDSLALTVQPGCDGAIAKLGFAQWRIDRGELVLVPSRGTAWRFELTGADVWSRVPATAERLTLVRQ
ncbi:MAG: AprI/Inh family metalloprotease inhibitor [Pseudolabrys sp.]|nr:AprI/Inh family metalloprotease inhibitor [Pseudolabrys sp.]